MANEEELQKKYFEYQMMEQQVKTAQEQLTKFEQQFQEIENVKDAITDLENAEEGKEILVPISSGIFIIGKLTNNKKCKVNVGAGVCVEKSLEDTKKLLDKQTQEIKKYKLQVEEHAKSFTEDLEKAEKEMEKLVKGMKDKNV